MFLLTEKRKKASIGIPSRKQIWGMRSLTGVLLMPMVTRWRRLKPSRTLRLMQRQRRLSEAIVKASTTKTLRILETDLMRGFSKRKVQEKTIGANCLIGNRGLICLSLAMVKKPVYLARMILPFRKYTTSTVRKWLPKKISRNSFRAIRQR